MDAHARVLFSVAALFNFIAALAFIFFTPQLADVAGMRPIPSDPLFTHFAAVLVLAFAWGYACAALDPVANRPLIRLGILGKSLVVLMGFVEWYLNNTNWVFPTFLLADAVFAALFADYLRRRPAGLIRQAARA
ncbi:MAG: hypothetical protein V4724_29005 [Pseudomonadota bacterium]